MQHNYELENLTIDEVKTLDALFLLKDKLSKFESSKPCFIVPVTYTKGWTIDYVESSITEDECLNNIISNAYSLKANNIDDLQVFNYKATKDYTEYAVVCNGVMYTFSDENKSYFANVFMRGNSSIITYNTNSDIKTKEEAEDYRKKQEQFKYQTESNIKAITKVVNKANLIFAENKIPLHIKYTKDEDLTFISPIFMYKDIVSDKLIDLTEEGITWSDIYAKRRVSYGLLVRERTGKIKLNVEIRRPESTDDIDTYIKECNLLSDNLKELAVVTSTLKKLADDYSLSFKLLLY